MGTVHLSFLVAGAKLQVGKRARAEDSALLSW